jgi:hypothetical protein
MGINVDTHTYGMGFNVEGNWGWLQYKKSLNNQWNIVVGSDNTFFFFPFGGMIFLVWFSRRRGTNELAIGVHWGWNYDLAIT